MSVTSTLSTLPRRDADILHSCSFLPAALSLPTTQPVTGCSSLTTRHRYLHTSSSFLPAIGCQQPHPSLSGQDPNDGIPPTHYLVPQNASSALPKPCNRRVPAPRSFPTAPAPPVPVNNAHNICRPAVSFHDPEKSISPISAQPLPEIGGMSLPFQAVCVARSMSDVKPACSRQKNREEQRKPAGAHVSLWKASTVMVQTRRREGLQLLLELHNQFNRIRHVRGKRRP